MIYGDSESSDRASEGERTSYIYCINTLSENSLNRQTRATQKTLKCKNICTECSPPKKATVSTDPLEDFEDDIDLSRNTLNTKAQSLTDMSRNYSPNRNIFKNSKRKSSRNNEPELKKYKHIDDWSTKYNSTPANKQNSSAGSYRKGTKRREISAGGLCDCEYRPCCMCPEKNAYNNSQAQTAVATEKINRNTGTKNRKKERKFRKEHFDDPPPAQSVDNYTLTTKKMNPKVHKEISKVEKSTAPIKVPKPKNRMTCLCHESEKNIGYIENVFAEGPMKTQEFKKGHGIDTIQNDYLSNYCENQSCPNKSTTSTNQTGSTTTSKIKKKILCLCHKYSQKMLKKERRRSDRGKQNNEYQNGDKLPCLCADKNGSNLNKNKMMRNEKEQTGDPFFEIKIDVVDKCVLNSNEIRENMCFLRQAQKKQPTCICPSHKRNLYKYHKRESCVDGICQKAFKDKKTNFSCKCSKIRECTDTTCEPDTKNKKKDKKADLKTLSLPSKFNKAMFNVKLDIDSMCVLNPNEVEKKISDAEIQAKKFEADVCHSGICAKTDRKGHFTCKCIEKKRKPEEPKVIECSNKTCGGKDMLPNNVNNSLKSNICELFKNIHVCECISNDGKQEGLSKNGTAQTKFRRVRKCLDTNEVQNIKSMLTFCCSRILNRSENFISHFKQRRGRHSKIHNINNDDNKMKKGRRPTVHKREGIKIRTKSKRIENKDKLKRLKNNNLIKQPKSRNNELFGMVKSHVIQSAYPNMNKMKYLLRGHEGSKNAGHDTNIKRHQKGTQHIVGDKYNQMLEMKVNRKNMNVLNAREVEEQIMDTEIQSKKNVAKKKKNIEEPIIPMFEIKLDSSSLCIINQEEVEQNIMNENLNRVHQKPESGNVNKKRKTKMVRRALDTKQYFPQTKSKSENASYGNSIDFCKGKICTPRVRDGLKITSSQKGGSFICSSLSALINRCKYKANRGIEDKSAEGVGMYRTNEFVSSQKYGSKKTPTDLQSCICCICGNQYSQCKCKIKKDTSLKQCFGDSLSCLLKILGIGDLLHSGNGDVRISKKNDLIKIEAKSTPREAKNTPKEAKSTPKKNAIKATEQQLQTIVKDKKGKKLEKQLKKEMKKEQKNEAKEKEKDKEEEVKEKEKEKEERKAKKREKEESKAKKKERQKNEAEKRKKELIEDRKRKKDSEADAKKLAKEMKKKQNLEAKQRIKELKEEEKEMEALRREDTTTDTNCLADLVIGILKLGAQFVYGALKILHKIITNPKGSGHYFKGRVKDPKGSIFKLKKWFGVFWRRQKFKIMKTVKGSHTLTVLLDTFQDTALFDAFRSKGRTDKERVFIEGQNKRRKRRITKRQNEAIYGCRHVLLTTLRKTPCLWVYHICPNHYPHCLSLLTFLKNFSDMMIFLLAVLFWTPCVLSFEILRALLCCFMCT